MANTEIIDCTTCKYGYEDERLGIQMCHHPKRFSEDCVDFNMHEEKDIKEPENPMEQDGLEEELERFIASGKSVTVEDCGTYKVSYHDFKKVARHFAQWGYLRAAEKYNEIEYNRQRAEEEIPKDLEEAAVEQAKSFGYMSHDREFEENVESFIAGYNLCKDQILKEAVEGVARPEDCEIWVNLIGYGYNFKDGQKVRVIIVKEDEK